MCSKLPTQWPDIVDEAALFGRLLVSFNEGDDGQQRPDRHHYCDKYGHRVFLCSGLNVMPLPAAYQE